MNLDIDLRSYCLLNDIIWQQKFKRQIKSLLFCCDGLFDLSNKGYECKVFTVRQKWNPENKMAALFADYYMLRICNKNIKLNHWIKPFIQIYYWNKIYLYFLFWA